MSKMLTGLVDIWRYTFPRTKILTFNSSSHAYYSKIDFFFTPQSKLQKTLDTEMLPITISDHAHAQ